MEKVRDRDPGVMDSNQPISFQGFSYGTDRIILTGLSGGTLRGYRSGGEYNQKRIPMGRKTRKAAKAEDLKLLMVSRLSNYAGSRQGWGSSVLLEAKVLVQR